jgi:hypothetical protein
LANKQHNSVYSERFGFTNRHLVLLVKWLINRKRNGKKSAWLRVKSLSSSVLMYSYVPNK